MIELRLKGECLATGKIGDYQLSDDAIEQLRKALPGTKVYSEPIADGEEFYSTESFFGVVQSVDGDTIIIDALEPRTGMPFFDIMLENYAGSEIVSFKSIRAVVVIGFEVEQD